MFVLYDPTDCKGTKTETWLFGTSLNELAEMAGGFGLNTVILLKLVALWNASSPIELQLLPITNSFILLQLKNADVPIAVTELGIFKIPLRKVQPANAPVGIDVSLSDKIKLPLNPLHPLNA